MKKLSQVLLHVFVFALATVAMSASSLANETTPSSTSFTLVADTQTQRLWDQAASVSGYYPDCRQMDGHHCPVSGVRARCYLYQYQEPMICICGSDNIWTCY